MVVRCVDPLVSERTKVSRPAGGSRFEDFSATEFAATTRLVHLLTGRDDVAEDLAQDAMARIHRHFDEIDDSKISLVRSVATSDGRLVALGSIQSTEPAAVSYSSETGKITESGHSDIAVWYSDDGQTWVRPALGELAGNQLQIPVSIAAGPHGFVGFVRLFDRDHYVEATIASADGEAWAISDSALNGPRTNLVATSVGWVGIGSERDVRLRRTRTGITGPSPGAGERHGVARPRLNRLPTNPAAP